MKIYNNVDNKVIFESDSEIELIDFVNKIRIENEDFDFSIIGMSDAVEYLEDYCDNLDLIKTEMERFDFYLDQKHTIWYRNRFSIEAETLEEAKAKVIEMYGKDDLPSDDWEQLTDTLEGMTPTDNGGEPTDELFTHDGDLVLTNKI